MGFEPTTFSLARRRTTTVLRPHFLVYNSDRECRDPGSNWGHRDFQSRALPTELSRPEVYLLSVRDFTRGNRDCQAMPCVEPRVPGDGAPGSREALLTSTCFGTRIFAYSERNHTS